MQIIPLTTLPRQTMTVQLGENLMLLDVWWQPSDRAWFISIQSPPNTPVTNGRRITVGSSLLPGHLGLGDLWCAEITGATDEPVMDSWEKNHRLIYEDARRRLD